MGEMVGTKLDAGVPQPVHGPIQVVKVDFVCSIYDEVIFPPFCRPVAARAEQAMEHGKEYGPFDGKPESCSLQHGFENRGQSKILPEPVKYQCGAKASVLAGYERPVTVCIDDLDRFGILEERPRDGVELAGLDEFIGFAYGGNYPLVNGLTFPLVFHDLEVRVAAGFLYSYKHGASPCTT